MCNLLGVIGIVCFVMLAWYAISAIFMRWRRPLFAGFYQYETGLFSEFGLPDWVDPAKYERTALNMDDGVPLALYVLRLSVLAASSGFYGDWL